MCVFILYKTLTNQVWRSSLGGNFHGRAARTVARTAAPGGGGYYFVRGVLGPFLHKNSRHRLVILETEANPDREEGLD